MGEGLWHFKMDANGEFVVRPVPVGSGSYRSTLQPEGDPLPAGESREVTLGQEMRISAETKGYEGYSEHHFGLMPGGVTDVGVVEMTRQGGEGNPKEWKSAVSGRVVNEKGEALPGRTVSSGIMDGPAAITDLQGRFELKDMPQGKVTVGVGQFGIYRPADVEVDSPAKEVELKMTPQGWDLWGKLAPEVMVDPWVSGEVKRIGDLKGKVVLLVVGMDPRQKREWERLQKLQEKFGPKGLVVVAVIWNISSVGNTGVTVEEVGAMGKKMGLAVGMDASEKRVDMDVPRDIWARGATELTYGVRDRTGEGAIFLVDRKGILVGAVNGEEEKRVEEALRE